jgi:hypothetical protein
MKREFRKMGLVLAMMTLVSSASAYAWPDVARPFCGDGYRRDSYGRGLEAGYRGGNQKPRLADDACYHLGFVRGTEIRSERPFGCEAEFNEGHKQGFAGEMEVSSSGGPCHNLGYEAGRASLDVAAREGRTDVVGSACVSAYSDGYRAALASMAAVFPSEQREFNCYGIGYADGQIFR